MDSEELSYWIAYDSYVEPIGYERDDIRTALLSATLTCALTGKKQEVDKHLLKFKQQGQKQSQAEIKNRLELFRAALNERQNKQVKNK